MPDRFFFFMEECIKNLLIRNITRVEFPGQRLQADVTSSMDIVGKTFVAMSQIDM